jgi:hypothetical protein
MDWKERLITESELAPYFQDGDTRRLEPLALSLIRQQKQTWPMLRDGYAALSEAQTKHMKVEEASIVVQYNPRRIKSVAAKVDKASVEARRCFLCADALPVEEKGIPYGDDLVILCNPFPILDNHLSIVHREHIEQKIYGNVESLLSLARDLGSEFFVLYNGPRCGASAPDHLHFQACSRKMLPIEKDLGSDDPASAAHCDACAEGQQNFELFTLEGSARSVVVFRGNRISALSSWIYRTLNELAAGDLSTEPMINLVCTYERANWTVYLFPRAKHRPARFFAEGEEQLLVSPGAIDMAGVIVVPELAHFEKITAEDVRAIYNEVSSDLDEVNSAIERVSEASITGGLF